MTPGDDSRLAFTNVSRGKRIVTQEIQRWEKRIIRAGVKLYSPIIRQYAVLFDRALFKTPQ